jgi:hypothetical protein
MDSKMSLEAKEGRIRKDLALDSAICSVEIFYKELENLYDKIAGEQPKEKCGWLGGIQTTDAPDAPSDLATTIASGPERISQGLDRCREVMRLIENVLL